MNVKYILAVVAVLAISCSSRNTQTDDEPESLTAYANPLIGTAHCRWFHFAPEHYLLVWLNPHLQPMPALAIRADGKPLDTTIVTRP